MRSKRKQPPDGPPPFAPTIVIDTREQTPLSFPHLPTTTDTLYSGDYSILGLSHLFSVERKSIEDLVSCCSGSNRERFTNELHRLRGFIFKRLLIVGSISDIESRNYHSVIHPASILGSLSAWEVRFNIPVVFEPTPAHAALRIERWAHYFTREIVNAHAALNP